MTESLANIQESLQGEDLTWCGSLVTREEREGTIFRLRGQHMTNSCDTEGLTNK